MTDTGTHRPEPDTRPEHGAGWLQPGEPVALQAVSPDTDTDPNIDGGAGAAQGEWQWIQHRPAPPPVTAGMPRGRRLPWRAWVGLAAALGVAVALVIAGIVSIAEGDSTPAVIPTLTAPLPRTTVTPAAAGACTGLSGQAVTDGPGDTLSLTGVIAAFEHAYYVQRNAEAALRLIAPQVGIISEELAAGIDSIPPGTVHCVAITPIAEGAAEVHLVELRPDGQRIDYLQLINARHDPDGATVITNIQKRG
ncbi:hypothetical protein [Nocardia xishanensis]|uniref:hypothetical protein n=1 Tax=Nocardia xishanensis TaxID=238964 RepID=UPI00082FC1B8|nr:hypothetical protein [Nocardia xishanensis]